MENVDKTIDAICNHIQKVLESEHTPENLPEEIEALAELVSGRATELEQLFEVDGKKLARNMNEAIRGEVGATKELVAELEKREGVETHIAGPYDKLSVDVNGPAIMLVVKD